mmetsp:Transcript_23649/g.38904  ORF Transcript_23649/g.38904 Transcript_23649/m.38904 type:complete len:690 (+) Transcript_23649:52-2121(+)
MLPTSASQSNLLAERRTPTGFVRKRKLLLSVSPLVVFASIYALYLLSSFLIASNWPSEVYPPQIDTFLTFTLGSSSIDPSCYNYWSRAKRPSLPNEWLNNLYHGPDFSWPQARFGIVNESDSIWYGGSPVLPHLWAKNVTRSAKQYYSDYVVLLSGVCSDVVDLIYSVRALFRGRRVVFLAFGDYQIPENIQFEDLGLYIIGKNSWHKDNVVANDQKHALIEIADVFISFSGWYGKGAGSVETPTIILYHNDDTDPEFNVTWLDPGNNLAPLPPVDEYSEDVPPAPTPATLMDVAQLAANMMGKQKADLVFHSYVDPTMGYGSSAEHMALALDRRRVHVRFLPIARMPREQWPSMLKNRTMELIQRAEISDYYLSYVVPHEWETQQLHRLARKAKIAIIYTTFETTKVPVKWVKYVNRYDKLIVSCEDIRKAFADGGVRIPIDIVPLGVDPLEWPILDKQRQWIKPFRFLLYADSEWENHRKNYRLVYDTFLKAFKDNTDVELLLKLTREDKTPPDIDDPLPQNVRLKRGRYTQKQLLDLLADSHALVFPSKGEGFGLPPREAMATGIPSLFAPFAGLSTIGSESISFPLKYSFAPAEGYDFWVKENNGSDYFGEWAAPDPDDLLRRMVEAAKNPMRTRDRGMAAAKWVRQHETYDHTGKFLMEAFRDDHLRSKLTSCIREPLLRFEPP